MNYTALYRQFRPQSFDELVGQDHISKTLLNGILAGKVAHAYLFSGPRGTGKTSTAKIFAKAINCLHPQDGQPCNECNNCIKIKDNNSLDVIEIDAASNRGIDEIRDLREKVKYAPAEGKFKVYIIDEVHMLTTEAFNALLKTLEEPPKHIVFILATTEAYKLPATIVSRCQRFDFKRIPFSNLLSQLKKVAAEVEIKVEEKALFIIAKKAEGGMRDALSLLDQSAAYGNGNVTYETVIDILGAVKETEILSLLKAIIERDAAAILHKIDKYVSQGKELKIILYELQEAVRNTILAKLSAPQPETLDTEAYQEMIAIANLTDRENLYHVLEILAETENAIKYAAQSRVTLEVGLLRTLSNANLKPTETSIPQIAKDKVSKQHNTVAAQSKPIITSNTNISYNQDDEGIKNAWKKLLDETKKTKKTLYAFLVEGKPVAFSNNIFKIEFDQEKEFHYGQIIIDENIRLLNQCIQKLWDKQIKLDFSLRGKEKQDNLSEKVINLFGKDKVEIID